MQRKTKNHGNNLADLFFRRLVVLSTPDVEFQHEWCVVDHKQEAGGEGGEWSVIKR